MRLNHKIGFAVIGLGMALLVAAGLYGQYQESQEWYSFSASHHCRATARVESSTSYGYLSNGNMGYIISPARTTYACDNNYTVTRSE